MGNAGFISSTVVRRKPHTGLEVKLCQMLTGFSQATEDQVAEKTTLLGFIVWRIKPECLLYREFKVLG